MRSTVPVHILRAGLLPCPCRARRCWRTRGACCRAEETFGDARAGVLRVPDGDTLVVDTPGYPPVAGRVISVRIAGRDTPEKRDPRTKLRGLSRRARELSLRLAAPGRTVTLRNLRRDKDFRLLADNGEVGGWPSPFTILLFPFPSSRPPAPSNGKGPAEAGPLCVYLSAGRQRRGVPASARGSISVFRLSRGFSGFPKTRRTCGKGKENRFFATGVYSSRTRPEQKNGLTPPLPAYCAFSTRARRP